MKTYRAWKTVAVAVALAASWVASETWAAEGESEQRTRRRPGRSLSTESQPAPQTPAAAPSQVPGETAAAGAVSAPAQTAPSVAPNVLSVTGNTQRGLAPTNLVVETAPVTVQDHGGIAGYLMKSSRLKRIVDLFNPRAPANLGVGGIRAPDGIGLKDGVRLAGDEPRLTPTQSGTLPRVFRDDRNHEPEGIILFNRVR